VLLDTSVLVGLERGTAAIPRGEWPAIAAMTAAELLGGLERADPSRRASRYAYLEAVFGRIPTLAFDLTTARRYAALGATLERAGTAIGSPDLEIAATALTHNLPLVTLNRRHFARVPGLRLV
jgi:tRNA(fMet)-specific endonuclease VapC